MFEGSYVALVTPFYPDGSVNFEKLKRAVPVARGKRHGRPGRPGHHGRVEHHGRRRGRGHRPLLRGRHRRPHPGHRRRRLQLHGNIACKEPQRSAIWARTAFCSITPYYNKANQKGMYRHFATVAEAVDLPIILYNVPGRTGCALSVECVEALSKLPNVRGIKEASGNISYTAKVARLTNDEFVLLSGNDDMIVPVLSLGGVGVDQRLGQHLPPAGARPRGRLPRRRRQKGAGTATEVPRTDQRAVHRGQPHPRQGSHEHARHGGRPLPPAPVRDGGQEPRGAAKGPARAGGTHEGHTGRLRPHGEDDRGAARRARRCGNPRRGVAGAVRKPRGTCPASPTPSSTFPTPATSKPRSRARRTPPPPSSSAPPA